MTFYGKRLLSQIDDIIEEDLIPHELNHEDPIVLNFSKKNNLYIISG